MIIIMLIIMGIVGLVVIKTIILPAFSSTKLTYPDSKDYVGIVRDMAAYKLGSSLTNTEIQTQFMKLIVSLGLQSLEKGHGVGYFRLPDLTPVYVLSTSHVIQQFYHKKNNKNFSQKKFFERLALILGDDNLMSSDLKSSTHSNIRGKVLLRNEAFRPKIAGVIADVFSSYAAKTTPSLNLAEFMDILSRKILLMTYFGDAVVEPFEAIYNAELTEQLMGCLFNLEKIQPHEYPYLASIRNKIFNMGCELIFLPAIQGQLLQQSSWLNYLLDLKVRQEPTLQDALEELQLNKLSEFDESACERLITYAQEHGDNNLLSKRVRDSVNESLFIPLLGFDATASLLLTSIKIAIQDKRIYSIIKREVSQMEAGAELKSAWDASDKNPLSFTGAVIMEALRKAPPAPMIPEIVEQPIKLEIDGSVETLPPGALVFMPLQALHVHSHNFPDIVLSDKGQQALDKETIKADDIFPERWLPVNPQGKRYNDDFFAEDTNSHYPGALEKEGGLLTFKTGGRRCPGIRLALSEAVSTLHMIALYKIDLTDEGKLVLDFNYETPLQRNGGLGLFNITPRKRLLEGDKPGPESKGKYKKSNYAEGIGLFDTSQEEFSEPQPSNYSVL